MRTDEEIENKIAELLERRYSDDVDRQTKENLDNWIWELRQELFRRNQQSAREWLSESQ
jgi:ribosomal protein L29